MPYSSLTDLPEQVRRVLPHHAQEIYQKAFNHAYETYKNPASRKGSREETSHRVAWAAVKQKYKKVANTEDWVPKECPDGDHPKSS